MASPTHDGLIPNPEQVARMKQGDCPLFMDYVDGRYQIKRRDTGRILCETMDNNVARIQLYYHLRQMTWAPIMELKGEPRTMLIIDEAVGLPEPTIEQVEQIRKLWGAKMQLTPKQMEIVDAAAQAVENAGKQMERERSRKVIDLIPPFYYAPHGHRREDIHVAIHEWMTELSKDKSLSPAPKSYEVANFILQWGHGDEWPAIGDLTGWIYNQRNLGMAEPPKYPQRGQVHVIPNESNTQIHIHCEDGVMVMEEWNGYRVLFCAMDVEELLSLKSAYISDEAMRAHHEREKVEASPVPH